MALEHSRRKLTPVRSSSTPVSPLSLSHAQNRPRTDSSPIASPSRLPNRLRLPPSRPSADGGGTSSGSGGGSGLLLRLFESEFFNVHLAISYLKTYPDSIGITYYLINRLQSFPDHDVEFYWPQLCHLLISKPSDSLALESFIINRCLNSTHLAMKTLWYLQSSLSDLAHTPATPSFAICRRTFNRVQSIIFKDPLLELIPTPQHTPDPRIKQSGSHSNHSSHKHNPSHVKNLKQQALKQLTRLKGGLISEKVLPTSLGIGLVLAASALPSLAIQTGSVPIEQSRTYDQPIAIRPDQNRPKSSENNSASDEDDPPQSSTSRSPSALKNPARVTTNTSRLHSTAKSSSQSNIILNTSNQPDKQTLKPNARPPAPRLPPDYTPGLPLTSTPFNHSNPAILPSASVLSPRSPHPLIHTQAAIPQHYDPTTLPLATPSISTAPITQAECFPITSLHSPDTRSDASCPPGPRRQTSMDPISPLISPYSSQYAKFPLNPAIPRPRSGSAISRSAPSLPDALSKAKYDAPPFFGRAHHPPTGILGRNGKPRTQMSQSNPVWMLSNALSIEPGEIPPGLLSQVLRSQSMRSQLELITSLQDIATRLVAVPKIARLSALRAELTVLNHSLPRGCCLGMHCDGEACDGDEADPGSGTGTAPSEGPSAKRRKCHHRVVRISPNESVVLNSADRAPFLIHVEVLEDHLDFDPSRRSNYEDLRKAFKDSSLFSGAALRMVDDASVQGSAANSIKGGTERGSDRGSIDQPAGRLKSPGLASRKPLHASGSELPNGLSLAPPGGPSETPSQTDAARAVPATDHASSTESPLNMDPDRIVSHSSGYASPLSAHSSLPEPPGTSTRSTGGRSVQSSERPPWLERSGQGPSLVSPPAALARRSSSPGPLVTATEGPDEEEMDLVEQIYGLKAGRASPPLEPGGELFLGPAELAFLPSGQHNKALDEEAWTRAEAARKALQTAPADALAELPNGHASGSNDGLRETGTLLGAPVVTRTLSEQAGGNGAGRSQSGRPTITLDEYAERMRMAAIMLAQLSASQQASQPLATSAAGIVVGGAIGLGAGFVGVTVGAGLGAVVSRRLAGQGPTVITSPIGRKEAVQASGGDAGEADGAASGSGGAGVQGRQKLLTAQQSEAIKAKIMAEMMALEEERMARMRLDGVLGGHPPGAQGAAAEQTGSAARARSRGQGEAADEMVVMKALNEEDPSGRMLGESWAEKRQRIRSSSPYGHLPNWNLLSMIVKTGADLRQEELITQLIREFGRIWREEGCQVWVRYYRIMVTGESTGLMETIVDAVSIHSLKKAAYAKMSKKSRSEGLPNYTMYDYYLETFGGPETGTFKQAQDNLMRSLVGYSIISYILQIKDRHNGNILIDRDGHIIHIDFGFVLANSPGRLGFEMAPFKLSQDYIELLGGLGGRKFAEFVKAFKVAFKRLRKHAERIITIVELMQLESRLPCFGSHGESTIKSLRDRFQLGLTAEQTDEFVERLILSSASSVFTRLYDSFQYYSQGVL